MLHASLLAWTLALPASLAMLVSTTVLSSTDLVCTTHYAMATASTSSSSQKVPTHTHETTIEHAPIMVHTTITPVTTKTPKPFKTKTTEFVASTVWVTDTPVNGTWDTTSTIFETSTFWYHDETYYTETSVVSVKAITRTTEWIPTPTGFLPIHDTKTTYPEIEKQLVLGHPHAPRAEAAVEAPSMTKQKCKKPLASHYPYAVECTHMLHLLPTETLVFSVTSTSTVTLPRETIYSNTTITANLTSTILSVPSGYIIGTDMPSPLPLIGRRDNADVGEPIRTAWVEMPVWMRPVPPAAPIPASAAAAPIPASAAAGPLASATPSALYILDFDSHRPSPPSQSSPIPPPPTTINITSHTITRTPYTDTATWTGSTTLLSTSTIHATSTLVLHAACAPQNLLYLTHASRRINGIGASVRGVQRIETHVGVADEVQCCEACVGSPVQCTFSLFEKEGPEKGRCVLWLVDERARLRAWEDEVRKGLTAGKDAAAVAKRDATTERSGAEGEERKETKQKSKEEVAKMVAAQAVQQQQMGVFGFRAGNGEGVWVASNGYYGFLSEGDLVFDSW